MSSKSNQPEGSTVDEEMDAAGRGDRFAMQKLGVRYATGDGVTRDYEVAVYYFKRAAQLGDVHSKFNLAVSLEFGDGIERNLQEALALYREAADEGDVSAAYNLGNHYLKDDPGLASHYLAAAAAKGHIDAMLNLAWLLRSDPVMRDEVAAAKWYLAAANSGDSRAQLHIGCMLDEGLGIQRDPYAALCWFRKAADQGNPVAQYNLALMLDLGQGGEVDRVGAVRWYEASAAQDYEWALVNLAEMLLEGDGGLEVNPVRAQNLLLRAAKQDNSEAQFMLGELCSMESAVPRDQASALIWYRRAAAHGHPDAIQRLDRHESITTGESVDDLDDL
jgi:TPR repeat protein